MIGLAIIRELIRNEVEVLVLTNPSSTRNAGIPKHPLVTTEAVEMSAFSSFHTDKKYDAFFHLAWGGTHGDARNDMPLQLDNARAAVEAVRLASRIGCEVFIGAGSQAEYGRVPDGTKLAPDTPTFPETGYGIAKLCAGQMTRVECNALHIRHIWMRILSVYGPHDGEHTMVMSGIRQLLAGERPTYTKGEQMWDYLYCDDAARAFMLACEKAPDGAVYALGGGRVQPLRDYITTIRDLTAPQADIGFGEVPYYDKQVMYLCADIDTLTADTGFTPQTSFEEGIKQTLEWIKTEK